MNDFAKLQLKKDILHALSKLKLTRPFEVQERIIPLAMQGKDIAFTSRTGSGKTLAYLLGFLGKINNRQGLQMLVLVPTRELCIQVGKEMQKVCDVLDINVGMLYGGRDIQGDYRTLSRKNQIIVGTPGRLLMHINEKRLKVGDVKYLVFDESDQMFDQGFYDDCVYLKGRTSSSAQVILSSATVTKKVKKFIDEEIEGHVFIQIGDLIPKNILQEKIYCDKLEKNDILLKLFKERKFRRAMVFCNTKLKSRSISDFLNDNKFHARSLSSDLDQQERLNHLNLFKDGKIRILVTTDVAARGIHIENVDMIINYDVPTRDEFYVHRIGRTGRTDKKGYSLTLVCPEDEDRWKGIESEYDLEAHEKRIL